jgi:hypothetical protein
MNPARQVTQLRDRGQQFVHGGVQQPLRFVRVAAPGVPPGIRVVSDSASSRAAHRRGGCAPDAGVRRRSPRQAAPRPRRRQLLTASAFRERLGYELGEAHETLLGPSGRRLVAHVRNGERAPPSAVDMDRSSQARLIPELVQPPPSNTSPAECAGALRLASLQTAKRLRCCRFAPRLRKWGGNTGGNQVGTERVLAWPRVAARVTPGNASVQAIPRGNRDRGQVERPLTEPEVIRAFIAPAQASSRDRYRPQHQRGIGSNN